MRSDALNHNCVPMDLDLDDLLASQVPADENNKRTPGQSVTKRAKDGGDENMLGRSDTNYFMLFVRYL